MIKVLIILSRLDSDGITNSTLLYMENMNRINMEIHIGVASEFNYNSKQEIERIEKLKIPIHFFPTRSRRVVKYCAVLGNFLKKNGFDIIHVMGNSATMAIEMSVAKRRGIPVRITHCHNTRCKYRLCNFLLRPLLYYRTTEFLACGIDAGKYLYGKRDFTVMPNGKDIKKFLFNMDNRKIIREEMHVCSKKVIGHIGKFTEQKNHIFLIEIFAKICEMTDEYELWLIGEGGEKEKDIHEMVKAWGLKDKIKFLGVRNDVEKILSAIDIMVFPSRYEGLPNVVIEGQIAQIPCLLSDTITRECKIMNTVKFLSLKASEEKWASEIMNIQIKNREGNQKMILEKMSFAGYDIVVNAEHLRKIYFKCAKQSM